MESKYIRGIGFQDDLEKVGWTPEKYSEIKHGYFYSSNIEYYLFADVNVIPINSGITPDLDYIPGTPYFIVDSSGAVTNMTEPANVYYLDVTANNVLTHEYEVAWEINSSGTEYNFHNFTDHYDGKYLVFDAAETFVFNKKPVETSNIVIKPVSLEDVYGIDIYPLWLGSAYEGMELKFYCKVRNIERMLLSGKYVEWHNIFIDVSGIEPESSGVPGTEVDVIFETGTTDSNGVDLASVLSGSNKKDLFVYVKCDNVRSKLLNIETYRRDTVYEDAFQLDMGQMWHSQEAASAIGMDAWGNLWRNTSEDSIITGLEEFNGLVTRGDWKLANLNYERPPIDDNISDKFPSSGTDSATYGTLSWIVPNYITSDDYANSFSSYGSGKTHYLKAKGFGFAIPTDATIINIKVKINCRASALDTFNTDIIRLLKAGTAVGDNLAAGEKWSYPSMTIMEYSDSNWGSTWTPADINDTNFGVIIAGDTGGSSQGFVNYVKIEITYVGGKSEADGVWSGTDFCEEYMTAPTDGDIIDFMKECRVAIKGFWGQVVVTGKDIRTTIPALDGHCLNKTDDHYIIHYSGASELYRQMEEDAFDSNESIWKDPWGIYGTWNDVKGAAPGVYDDYYYVLYASGYTGYDPAYFQSNDFYFRGIAVVDLDDSGVFVDNSYKIKDLLSEKKLQP